MPLRAPVWSGLAATFRLGGSLCDYVTKVLVASVANRLVVTLTVDVRYLIAARRPAIASGIG